MDCSIRIDIVSEYFEGEITRLEQEILEVKFEKDEKEQMMSVLSNKIRELENEILGMDEKVEIVGDDLGRFEEEIQVLQGQKFVKSQIVSNLNKMLNRIEVDILGESMILGKYEERVKDLKGIKSMAYQMIDEMKSELDESMSKLKAKDEAIGVYSRAGNSVVLKMIDKVKDELSKSNKGIYRLRQEAMEKDQVIAKYKKKMIDFDKVKDELSKSNQGISRLRQEAMEKDQVIAMYKKKMIDFDGTVEKLQSEIQDLKGGKLAADRMINEMMSELSMANTEQNKIKSESEGKMAGLKSQILEKDEIIGAYQKKLRGIDEKQIKSEIQILKRRILRDNQLINEMISEQSKVNSKKNKVISELDEDARKLEKKLYEKEQVHAEVVQAAEKEIQCLNQMIEKMKSEQVATAQLVEKMRRDQLAAHQTIQEMKFKQSEATSAMEELKRQNVEAFKIVEVLGRQVLGAHATKEAENVSYSKDENQSLRTCTVQGSAKNDVRVVHSTRTIVPSACNSTKHTCSGLEKMGSKNQGEESGKNAENLQQAGSLSGYNPQAGSSGMDTENKCLRLKRTGSSEQGEKSGENPNRAGSYRHIPLAESSDVNLDHEFKRLKRTDFHDRNEDRSPIVSPNNSVQKRKPSDLDSTDSDKESRSGLGKSEVLVNGQYCQKLCRTWMSVAEMRKELEEDIEFCMHAVCVLYRHNISNPGELRHSEAMRVNKLAEYLINGDTQHRLRRFVSEVKEDYLASCRQLARDYSLKLFKIFHIGDDILFRVQ